MVLVELLAGLLLAVALIESRQPELRRPVGGRRDLAHRLAEAHRIHHLYGGAPYGMLLPVVPAELRERANHTDRNPLVRS